MRSGEYVIGKQSRGWVVTSSKFWVIYAQKGGDEFVELIQDVRPILCYRCGKLRSVNDRPWHYANGDLVKGRSCKGCGRIRYESKEPGWRVWHLKKCPGCGKNPRRGDSMMRPDRRPRYQNRSRGRVFSIKMISKT